MSRIQRAHKQTYINRVNSSLTDSKGNAMEQRLSFQQMIFEQLNINKPKKKKIQEFLFCLIRLRTQHSLHEEACSIPRVTQRLRIQHCYKLQHRSQMWLGTGVAMAVLQACNCSSHSTPSPGTSLHCMCGCTKKKKFITYFSISFFFSFLHIFHINVFIHRSFILYIIYYFQ